MLNILCRDMRGMLGRYIVLVWLLVLVSATDEPEKGCVNHPPSSCPVISKDAICQCERVEADTTVVCCNIHSEFKLKESLSCAFKKENRTVGQQSQVTALHIFNCTMEKLDVSLPFFQGLIGLSVTHSNVPRIMGKFPSSITCLNLSSNHLLEIDPMALTAVPQLGYLDLSNNNLTHPPKLELKNPKSHFFIDLSGNPRLECKLFLHELKAQRSSNIQINYVHENETFCTTAFDYHWFNSTSIVPVAQLETYEKVEKECPGHRPDDNVDYKCRCHFERSLEVNVDHEMGSRLNFITVDCSGQGLTSLPKGLPPNTTTLNISNNHITNLDYMGEDESYSSLTKLFADNNRIQSITVLEGSQFIEKFSALSLRNNNIKEIPKYLLSNVFDRISVQKNIQLGQNKLQCDCSTAPLKVWLLSNKIYIKDYDELLCENLNIKVIDLEQTMVCIYPRDWTDYIYYIIALEVLLFVMLISKVSYDYWVFKTTGYLPWPASKMPRLPCDWVFEL